VSRPDTQDRQPDVLDQASQLTQALTDVAVANARVSARPEQVQRPDGSWPQTECECGEPINEGRLALGKIRCIACQQDLEKERRARR